VIDVSLSIIGRDYARVRGVIERVIRAGNPMGLVIFSDAAYELLPPRTPAKELRPLLRFFTLTDGELPENPWTPSLRAGTRISSALALAQDMLERDQVAPASILLVSDLETAPSDLTPLGKTLSRIEQSSTTLRVVQLSASSDAMSFFGGILGPDAFVEPVEPDAGATPSLDVSLHGESPFWLLLAGGLVLVVLAAHERFAGRLALPAKGAAGGDRETARGHHRCRSRASRSGRCSSCSRSTSPGSRARSLTTTSGIGPRPRRRSGSRPRSSRSASRAGCWTWTTMSSSAERFAESA
jgi:hypothetical protein